MNKCNLLSVQISTFHFITNIFLSVENGRPGVESQAITTNELLRKLFFKILFTRERYTHVSVSYITMINAGNGSTMFLKCSHWSFSFHDLYS